MKNVQARKNFFSAPSRWRFSSVALLAAMFMFSACSSRSAVQEYSDSENVSDDEIFFGSSKDDASLEAAYASDEWAFSTDAEESLSFDDGAAFKPKAKWAGSLKSKYMPGMTEWVVSRGESLSLIARAVYGSSSEWRRLHALNPEIDDANILSAGQKIRLPGADISSSVRPLAEPELPSRVEQVTEEDIEKSMYRDDGSGEDDLGAMAKVSSEDKPMMDFDEPPVAEARPVVEAPALANNALSGMIKKVDTSTNKSKVRNLLLGVAAFFLVLSGVIFILSRKRGKAS